MKLKASNADHEKETRTWVNERKDMKTKIDQLQAEIDKISKENGELHETVSNLRKELDAQVWIVDIHVLWTNRIYNRQIDNTTYRMSVSGQWDLLYDEDRVVYTLLKLPDTKVCSICISVTCLTIIVNITPFH